MRSREALARYKLIEISLKSLVSIPIDSRIEKKLVSPIRQAIGSYMVGGFLATIALCGYAAEMLVILLWEMADVQINNRSMDTTHQELLLGRKFEKLGQERRIKVLEAYGIVQDRDKRELMQIKDIRNKYLHLWSHDHDTLESDSAIVLQLIVSLLHIPFPQNYSNGQMLISGMLAKYLEKEKEL